ncbi:hypothetical protein KSP35_17625 [Aquihabitans sp. G128]|uniref:hypothetical protein n=1 Tax=Aquihabitans sp. G128 TaxID=2849779 RepID=UPI001C236F09|nr:hypothetical protein [Aquihabitans sp. G128]QXC60158.1 hypothetical protein KSP35_17625 [Aquihabitans sp. G128]
MALRIGSIYHAPMEAHRATGPSTRRPVASLLLAVGAGLLGGVALRVTGDHRVAEPASDQLLRVGAAWILLLSAVAVVGFGLAVASSSTSPRFGRGLQVLAWAGVAVLATVVGTVLDAWV